MVDLPEHQLRDFLLLFSNPLVSKIMRIKWAREFLHIGLNEALNLIEEATAFYEPTYEELRRAWEDPEVADYRNNHGQED